MSACLQVLEPGLLTTVQDLGRRGYERLGVPVAGAMDEYALRAANGLVGNPPDAAGLEMTLAGPRLRADENCLIAVCGADLGLRVNGWRLPGWMAVFVRRGWEITFEGKQWGCRAYLAVAGGIDVPAVLGSRSTYLRGGFGGYEGRALRPGDRLPVGEPSAAPLELAGRRLPERAHPPYSDNPTLEVILGPQQEAFTPEGMATFLSGEYAVEPASDRMGYRLRGPGITHRTSADIVSDGIVLGAVQVPASGQPIVTLADRQTTGGYTQIAVVVRADIPLLAQCVPGKSQVRFRPTTVEAAQARYRMMIETLDRGLQT
ncbi:MAG: biotin-dependent carboxyltransferase family protein [Chloroflexota bacterium]